MGSFWGHVDGGLNYILLAVWWMLNAFRDHILAENKGAVIRPNIHYDIVIGNKQVPIEVILKTLFPLVGRSRPLPASAVFGFLGFLGEVCVKDFRLLDDNGHLINLANQQHMTIYGMFLLHGVTDLMARFRAPMFPGFNYMTWFLAFLWQGIAFYYHASMHGKEPVETIIHLIPIPVIVMVAIATILEMIWREGVWTLMVRSYGVLTLGTWFCHVAFVLWVSDRFPGGEPSDLDRSDPNNVTFVKAMFGLHLLANLGLSLSLYMAVYMVLKVRIGIRIQIPKYGKLQESYSATSHYSGSKPKHKTRKEQDIISQDSSKLLEIDQAIVRNPPCHFQS